MRSSRILGKGKDFNGIKANDYERELNINYATGRCI